MRKKERHEEKIGEENEMGRNIKITVYRNRDKDGEKKQKNSDKCEIGKGYKKEDYSREIKTEKQANRKIKIENNRIENK